MIFTFYNGRGLVNTNYTRALMYTFYVLCRIVEICDEKIVKLSKNSLVFFCLFVAKSGIIEHSNMVCYECVFTNI